MAVGELDVAGPRRPQDAMAENPLPSRLLRGDHLRQVDPPRDSRPGRRQPAFLRARALARGDQPADALAAPARARGARDRRAPHLPRGPAAGRVRADREGPRAGAADRGHAHLRPPLAPDEPRRPRAAGRRPIARRRRRAVPHVCRYAVRSRRSFGAATALAGQERPGRAAKRAGMRDLVVREALERSPATRRSACASWSPSGEEIPYDVTEPGEGSPLAQYEPADRALHRDHATALLELDSFGSGCAAIESAELAGPYLERSGSPFPPTSAARPSSPASPSSAGCGGIDRLLARRRPARGARSPSSRTRRAERDEIEVLVPLLGLQLPTTRLELAQATIVRADTVEVPPEARTAEGARRRRRGSRLPRRRPGGAPERPTSDDEPRPTRARAPWRFRRADHHAAPVQARQRRPRAPRLDARCGDRWRRIATGAGRPGRAAIASPRSWAT